MKRFWKNFLLRGLVTGGFGPLVLAVIYGTLYFLDIVATIAAGQVCLAIVTIYLLAFVAGGITVVYQEEKLPLPLAVLFHGCVLYVSYLVVYLVNGWLAKGMHSVLVFSLIFVVGYLVIWAFIYAYTKRSTRKITEKLQKNRERE
jgi:hypothetical protein